VTEDVEIGCIAWFASERIQRHFTLILFCFDDHCVHSIDSLALGLFFLVAFLDFNGTCDDVADDRLPFRQVCCKIHLFPFECLLEVQTREAKVRADRFRFTKVNLAIYQCKRSDKNLTLGLDVNVLRVCLFWVNFHPEST
jgi:hypothetical protein